MRRSGVRGNTMSLSGLSRGWWLWLVIILLLGACGRSQQTSTAHVLEPIAPGDECYVCGMEISHFPGPKAEVFIRGEAHPLKFCSTRDLFAFLLQPESAAIVEQVFVQDMAATDWQHPGDRHFVDGRSAWYVVDQPLPGAMGPTLASFHERADAESFAAKHGGRIMSYAQIDLDVMEELNKAVAAAGGEPPHHHAPP